MEQTDNLSDLRPVRTRWRKTPKRSGGWIRELLALLAGVAVVVALTLVPFERLLPVALPVEWVRICEILHHLLHYLSVAFLVAAVGLHVADAHHTSMGLEQAVCRLLAWGWVSTLLVFVLGVPLAGAPETVSEFLIWHRGAGAVLVVVAFRAWALKRRVFVHGREDQALAFNFFASMLIPLLLVTGLGGFATSGVVSPQSIFNPSRPAPAEPEADPALALKNRWPGVLLQPIREGEPDLALWRTAQDVTFGDGDLALLAPLAARLRWLDLSRTSISDASAESLAGMTGLVRLKLGHTRVTDAVISSLAGLPNLEYLDLSGTDVGDEGLAPLEKSPSIRRLVLWRTRATPEGLTPMAQARPDLTISLGWEKDRALSQVLVRASLGEGGYDSDVENGLALYLPLDGSVGEGTPSAQPEFAAGVEKQAVRLSEDFSVSYGTEILLDRDRPVTISFWLKAESADGAIVAQRTEGETWQGVQIGLENRRISWACFARAPDDGVCAVGRRPIALDTWHHVAVVYDGSSRGSGVRLFVDGLPEIASVSPDQLSGALLAVRTLTLGASGGTPGLKGWVDEVRIHDRKLPPDTLSFLARKEIP